MSFRSRPRWRFWEKEPALTTTPAPAPGTLRPPRWQTSPLADPDQQRKLDQLRRRREMIAYDLERAESAHEPANPWQERIALLDESLATIEGDLAALAALPPAPAMPLPPVPITELAATTAEPALVTFRVGAEPFIYGEETDWDQRGGPVVRGDLRHQAGEPVALLPPDVPADLHDPLLAHLGESLHVFATDLRDRALEGEPLPAAPTLADLARPDETAGGWHDWGGASAVAAQRAWQRQQLEAEGVRLAEEREGEQADRVKWAERLPIARRRLVDVDGEIATLERTARPG